MTTTYPVILIDPSLLAIPNAANSVEEAEQLLWRVVQWARCLSKAGPFRIAQLEGTIDLLAATNHFPAGPNIIALLEMHSLDHVISSEDIRRSINLILERAPYCVKEFGIEVTAHSDFDTTPNNAIVSNDPDLKDACERTAATALCCEWLGKGINASVFVAGGLPDSCARTIQIKTEIDDLIHALELPDIQIPFSIFGPVQFCSHHLEALASLDPLCVWRNANNSKELFVAILFSALSILRSTDRHAPVEQVPEFRVGSDFYKSLRDINVLRSGHAAVVLETCARLVLGEPKAEIKPLLGRTSSKGKSHEPIKREDGSIANRTHIGKRHEALRLMFWKTPVGVELANVGPKNQLEIRVGEVDKATHLWW